MRVDDEILRAIELLVARYAGEAQPIPPRIALAITDLKFATMKAGKHCFCGGSKLIYPGGDESYHAMQCPAKEE